MQIPDGSPLADLARREDAIETRRRTVSRLRPPRRAGLQGLVGSASALLRRRDMQTALTVVAALGAATLILRHGDRRR